MFSIGTYHTIFDLTKVPGNTLTPSCPNVNDPNIKSNINISTEKVLQLKKSHPLKKWV